MKNELFMSKFRTPLRIILTVGMGIYAYSWIDVYANYWHEFSGGLLFFSVVIDVCLFGIYIWCMAILSELNFQEGTQQ